ncbi:MAG TPA: hypothetical protein HPP56_09140 [Nitrospirae bacterium]|nr:hypothetical protein [Nitrospirota bacterium]
MSLKVKTLINGSTLNSLLHGDALCLLKQIDDNSIDLVLTDPPYFLDKMDNKWDSERVANIKNLQVVKSLPAGMRFDKEQGKRFYDWYCEVSLELLRITKPGGAFPFQVLVFITEWYQL